MTTAEVYSNSVKRLRDELGEPLFRELVQKASGTCYLCEGPMDLSRDDVQKDHVDPKGQTVARNLYLAHRSCNALKRDLPAEDAKRMIRFRKFCESKSHDVSFDDIIDQYLVPPKREHVRIEATDGEATIRFSRGNEARVNVSVDPATGIKYCFAEVPTRYFHNDKEVQPRRIEWDHVWAMAQDFTQHPIHEPSSCRYVEDRPGTGSLFQFDGQHKTAAQIILGRSLIQTKIYLNPPVPTIRSLIISIQNKIRKRPLATSTVITKLADNFRDQWEKTGAETELDFVKSYRSDQQAGAKKALQAAWYSTILDAGSNKFIPFVQQKKSRRGAYPVSMNNMTNLILKELVCQEPQEASVGTAEDLRSVELENVLALLNQLAEDLLLGQKWQFELAKGTDPSREYRKAQRFFTPGSVKYWAPTLKKAIVHVLNLNLRGPKEESRPLLRTLTQDQQELIRHIVERLCEHPIWTDSSNPNVDGMLRENRPATSIKLFTEVYSPALDPAYLVGLQND